MLYKYRFRISVLLFLATIFVIGALFGAAVCSDGWASGSIGSRGACSHHGGVSSIAAVVSLIAACIAVIVFNSYVDGKYRQHKCFIVKHDLPCHPLESASQIKPEFAIYDVPTLSAKSRKYFQCGMCKKNFESGTVYSYADQKNEIQNFVRHAQNQYLLQMKKQFMIESYIFQTKNSMRKQLTFITSKIQ